VGEPALTRLERLVRTTQAEARIPALSVALHRADRSLWTFQVGTSGRADAPLHAGTLFRMGSVTKTFTAVLVMQCRDDGLLDLDDPISAHLSVPAHGEMTIRRLMSHTSGLQREPYGDIWDALRSPEGGLVEGGQVAGGRVDRGPDRFLADLARAERVLPAARCFHYSNLGVSLLGLLVGRLRGGTWAEVLSERVLRPLGLADVFVDPGDRAAVGYLVDAYSDHVRPEPPVDFGPIGPAGQLWATAADLARWAAFLADPAGVDEQGAVLGQATVDEMRWPVTVTDSDVWATGFGLGLLLVPQPDRVLHVGHDGAMPGFLAGVYGRHGGVGTPGACGAAVLGSSGTAIATLELPHQLLRAAVEEDPAEVPVWVPGQPAPPEYRSILGHWWSEGFEFVFSWHKGALQARRAGDPPGRPPATFAPVDGETDVLRTVSGREVGERLRLTRDQASGAVVRMHWATYPVTRAQVTFDAIPVSEP
jgi:CubicO group peptidase (beta-lactamase class C family)